MGLRDLGHGKFPSPICVRHRALTVPNGILKLGSDNFLGHMDRVEVNTEPLGGTLGNI